MRMLAAPGILIVDDALDVRHLLRVMLAREGFHTETATNGREALELLKRAGPSIVLLGRAMPYMTGEEVLTALKQTPDIRRRHWIILMSAHLKVDEVAVAAGADSSLSKPFTVDQLLNVVSDGLRWLHRGPGPNGVH
ncbi:MAG: response regulator [Ktedonobacterales bacterium]